MMIWINKESGELVELRLTSVGEDTWQHEEFKSYEISGVIIAGETPCEINDLEFIGWL